MTVVQKKSTIVLFHKYRYVNKKYTFICQTTRTPTASTNSLGNRKEPRKYVVGLVQVEDQSVTMRN